MRLVAACVAITACASSPRSRPSTLAVSDGFTGAAVIAGITASVIAYFWYQSDKTSFAAESAKHEAALHSEPASRELALQFTKEARKAAKRHQCERVRMLAWEVSSFDHVIYSTIFLADPAIEACVVEWNDWVKGTHR